MKIEKKLKSRKGFTLVELVVVIAVLAILAGVGSVAYSGYIKRARDAADLALLDAVKTAVDAAYAKDEAKVVYIEVTNATSSGLTIKVSTSKTDGTGAAPLDTTHKADFDIFFDGNESKKLEGTYAENGAKWTTPTMTGGKTSGGWEAIPKAG